MSLHQSNGFEGHLLPDRSVLERYIAAIFRHADPDTYVSARIFRDDGKVEAPVHISAHRLDDSNLYNAIYEVAHKAAVWREPAVFSPIPSTFKARSGAKLEDLANGLAIVAELDTHPGESLTKLRIVLGPPTLVVASGGIWIDADGTEHDKLHAYWRLTEPTRDREDHELLKEARTLACALVGADATSNSPVHPLRIAGSVHRKATPRIALVIEENDTEVELAEAVDRLHLAVSRDPEATDRRATRGKQGYIADPFAKALDTDPYASVEDVRAALEVIPNDASVTWDEWNRVGMAVFRGTEGSDEGLDAFDTWSQKSSKYHPHVTLDRWKHYFRSPPTKIGFGTLYHLAREVDPTWRKPSGRARDQRREADAARNEERFRREVGPSPQHGKGDEGEADNRYVIDWIPGQLHRVVDEAEQSLIQAGVPIYARGPNLVRPVIDTVQASRGRETKTAKLRDMAADAMTDTLSRTAIFQRFNGREKKLAQINPPSEVSRILLSREGSWRLPPIAGVITTPTLRPDGSVLSTPGYDASTRLYLISDETLSLPLIAQAPTREEALEALALLKGLLLGFPFKSDAARSVALSGMITAVGRGAMNVAPLHVIRAHTRGTGKSFLVDLVSTISAGRPCPVIAAGKTEEETEKRLGALLREGVPLVSIDNVNGELGGAALCQMISQPVMRVRILGKSEAPEFENRATVFATGNNLRLVGDMTRRAILCDLDAKMERPEKRSFDFDPLEYAASMRGDYVAAALTIVRAYLAAGSPAVECSPLAGFEDWSRLVRSPLIWLGEADPITTMDQAQDEDPERVAILEVFEQWKASMPIRPGQRFSTADVLKVANERDPGGTYENADLRDALLAVAGAGGAINARVLGCYLASISGRIVGGLKLERWDTTKGPRYSLESIDDGEAGNG